MGGQLTTFRIQFPPSIMCDPEDQTQVVRPDRKRLNLLSHLLGANILVLTKSSLIQVIRYFHTLYAIANISYLVSLTYINWHLKWMPFGIQRSC